MKYGLFKRDPYPIPSIYGIQNIFFLHLVVLNGKMVNLGKYTIHGCYGCGLKTHT